jgi:two-component system LytT family response regulator
MTSAKKTSRKLRKDSGHKTDWYFKRIMTSLQILAAARTYRKRLLVPVDGRFILLKVSEIDWIEAEGNYVRVHRGQKQHLVRRRIGELETALDHDVFVRINRSAILNIDRIRELQPVSHGDLSVVMDDGTELVLSRNYRKNLQHLLG